MSSSKNYRRKSIRLQGYDYSQPGAYFITLVAENRISWFGEIHNRAMHLNECGIGFYKIWQDIPKRFPNIILDEFILMPNHLHGIIWIKDSRLENLDIDPTLDDDAKLEGDATLVVIPDEMESSTRLDPTLDSTGPDATGSGTRPHSTKNPTIGDIIGAYKSLSTNYYIKGVKEKGWPRFKKRFWQANYYERIIRNEKALNHIRKYIQQNPLKWALDHESANATTKKINCFLRGDSQ